MTVIKGIVKEGNRFKIATVRFEKKSLQIEKLETVSSLSKTTPSSFTVSGLQSHRLLIRHLKLPLKKRRALRKTLPFQIENLIPYSMDEIMVAPFYRVGKDQTHAIFYMVSKKNLKEHLQEMQIIDPIWVSSFSIALMRFAHLSKVNGQTFLALHVGEQDIELALIEEEVVLYNLSLKMGMQDFKEAYKKDYKDKAFEKPCDLTQVSKEDAPFLKSVIDRFIREIERSFCFLSHKIGKKSIESIFLVGQINSEFNLESYLKKHLETSLIFLPMVSHRFDESILKEYAIPIGLAIDAWKGDRKSLQFRQGEWIALKTYQKLKKTFFNSFLISLFCIILFFLVGHLSYKKKEKIFLQQIDNFIADIKEVVPKLEEMCHLKKKEEKLALLSHTIPLVKKEPYYFSNSPRVADFLAFLSDHPLFKKGSKAHDSLHINQFSYELVTYPCLEKPFEKYKRKVELSFTSDNALLSRQFHDAIVENEDWFDSDEEVIWDRKQNEYTFQFFIK